jgi:uncharacterized protein
MRSEAESSALVDAVLKRTAEAYRGKDPAHRDDHIQNVIANCRAIFHEVRCDQELVELSAALHDVGPRDFAINADDEPSSRNIGSETLREFGVPEFRIATILDCIRTASWEHHIRDGSPSSVEAFVLRDADLLEAIGAQGVARVFAFAGANSLSLKWTHLRPDSPRRLSPNRIGIDKSPFTHFETKLLWIQELLYSNIAKTEARRRHDFLLKFLDEYSREQNWHRDDNLQ